jgi:hypothetical protein
MKPQLVDDWRGAWRWVSVQVLALQGAAAAAWLAVPEEMRAAVPADWLAYAAVALTLIGIPGRMIKQRRA